MRIRILLADDHPVVRHGLRQILTAVPEFSIAAEAANHGEILAAASNGDADVVMLDMSMPGRSGMESLADLKSRFPRLPVLVLSQHPANQFAVRAIQTGAAGYLSKDCDPETLVSAVRAAASGRSYITIEVAELLAAAVRGGSSAPHDSLSPREHQVFLLLAAGQPVSQIALRLHLSVKTVSTHRTHILEKMGMQNNAELIRYAVERKLLGPSIDTDEG